MKPNYKKRKKYGRRDFMKISATAGFGMGMVSAGCSGKKERNNALTGCLAQDFSIVLHNPDIRRYVEGCGLVRMADGSLIAVVPVVPRSVTIDELGRGVLSSNTYIMRSTDGGISWDQLSQLPYYSAVPWIYRDSLYLFAMPEGTRYRNDDFLLLRSDDAGESWSDPITLFRGHFWNCHTSMVTRDDHIYWAVCDLGLDEWDGPQGLRRGPRVIAGDLKKNLMDKNAWRLSDPVPFPGIPDALINPKFKDRRSRYLEPNVIEVGGQIRLISAVKPARNSTTGLAAVLDMEDINQHLNLVFTQYHPRPGGQLKFFILWDEVTQMFWSTANLPVDTQGLSPGRGIRRHLMLFYGLDGLNWFQAGCIAQAERTNQGFHYATPVIDGDDLVIISRTSIDGPRAHDADYATFHRIKNFRELAFLKLIPESV